MDDPDLDSYAAVPVDVVSIPSVGVTSTRGGGSDDVRSQTAAAFARRDESLKPQSSSVRHDSSGDKYLYRHPKEFQYEKIVFNAILKAQSGIGTCMSAVDIILKTIGKSDVNVVIQTFRMKESMAERVKSESHNARFPIVFPPIIHEFERMTMADRKSVKASNLGYIRITLALDKCAVLHFDTMIPCFYGDARIPVVGFGPSINLKGLDFVSKVTSMMNSVAAASSTHGHIILDHQLLTFGWFSKSSTSVKDEQSGTYVPIVTNDQNSVSMNYAESLEPNSNLVIDNTTYCVPTLDNLTVFLSNTYRCRWNPEKIAKLLQGVDKKLDSHDSRDAGKNGSEKDTGDEEFCLRIVFTHIFVPPKSLREDCGWFPDKVIPDVADIGNFWGFIERVTISSHGNMKSTTSSTSFLSIDDPESSEFFSQVPYSAIQDYFKIIAKSSASSSKSFDQINTEIHDIFGAEMMAKIKENADVLPMFCHKKQITKLLSIATKKNVILSTFHSRKSTSDDCVIFFQYVFSDKLLEPGKQEAYDRKREDSMEKPLEFNSSKASMNPLSKVTSSYITRPSTLACMAACKPDVTVVSELNFDSASLAPNGVPWKKLIFDISWDETSDNFRVYESHTEAMIETAAMRDPYNNSSMDVSDDFVDFSAYGHT